MVNLGFGSMKCDNCGKEIAHEPDYYAVVKKTVNDYRRCRKQKILASYCHLCAIKLNIIPIPVKLEKIKVSN